jgi:hypothetical protein
METRPSRSLLAKIKISQLNTNLEALPIMQTHLLTKLLAMTACTQIDYSGAGSKVDACHIAHFLKFEKDGATLREFKTMKDFQEFVDMVEKCFCAIAMETKRNRAFFRDVFRPMRAANKIGLRRVQETQHRNPILR